MNCLSGVWGGDVRRLGGKTNTILYGEGCQPLPQKTPEHPRHIGCAHCFVRYWFMFPSYSILRGRRLHDEVGSARFPLAAHGIPRSTSFDRRCWHNCGCIHPCVPRCSQQFVEVVWHTQGTSRYVEVCRRGVGLADTLVPGIVEHVYVFFEHVHGRVHQVFAAARFLYEGSIERYGLKLNFSVAKLAGRIERPLINVGSTPPAENLFKLAKLVQALCMQLTPIT